MPIDVPDVVSVVPNHISSEMPMHLMMHMSGHILEHKLYLIAYTLT